MILTAALELSRNQVTHFYSLKKDTDEMIKMADSTAYAVPRLSPRSTCRGMRLLGTFRKGCYVASGRRLTVRQGQMVVPIVRDRTTADRGAVPQRDRVGIQWDG